MTDAKKIIDFVAYAEKLKVELRHATKSDRNRESVAEHCWRLSLLIMLAVPHLKVKVDLCKILKMAIIHDLGEIESKDITILKRIDDQKMQDATAAAEKKAMAKIKKMLGADGAEIYNLWAEFENQKTNEAKVLKALDRLEGQLQFLHDPIAKFTKQDQIVIDKLLQNTTELAAIDPFLQKLDQISLPERKNRIKH